MMPAHRPATAPEQATRKLKEQRRRARNNPARVVASKVIPAGPSTPPRGWQSPMEAPTGPALFTCGACHSAIPDVGVGRYMRCEHCGRTLCVPSRVRLICQRCSRSTFVPPPQLAIDQHCGGCGAMLPVGEVTLMPRRRRRVEGRSPVRVRHVSRGDGALAVLIVGIALILAVVAATVL